VKIELTAPNSYSCEITIELSWDEIAQDYGKTEQKIIKTIKMPGFRPGKVPKKVVLKQYQPAIEAQFVDEAIQKYFMEALREKKITPINQAKVDDISFKQGEPFSFKLNFEIEPVIELPELKKNNLKVDKTVYISDQQDIEDAIADMQERFSEVVTVEDGSKEGDFVVADLQKLDSSGLPLIGKKLEQRYIKVGEGVIGGNANTKPLLGLKSGDTTRIELPEGDGPATNTYEVTVHNVEQRAPAEINEDFIKQVDPVAKDEADWRERIKERIDENLAHRSDESFNRSLSDAMIELVQPEFPPSMVETYLDRILEDMKKNNSGKIDEAQIREAYRSMAEHNLKWYLIHGALIKSQKFSVSQEDIDQEIQRLVDRTPTSEKEIRKFYKKPSNRHKLEDDLLEKMILGYLQEYAKIKEVKVKTKDLREQAAREEKNG